jgi:hypothetical protein
MVEMRDFDKSQENGPPSPTPMVDEGLSAQNRNTLFNSLTRIRGAAELLSDLSGGGPRGDDILRKGGLAFLASIIDEESLNLMIIVQALHTPPGA